MRLRYLNLSDAPPLQQLSISFHQEEILGRQCAIRFIVGVNGSGKSRLLQALAQIFLALERAPNIQLPFFVTLVYDLGSDSRRTIYLQYQPTADNSRISELKLIEYKWLTESEDWDWENLSSYLSDDSKVREFDSASGSIDSFLPKSVLAYTSGATEKWKTIFAPHQLPVEIPTIGEAEERPLDWDVEREKQLMREQGLDAAAAKLSQADITSLREGEWSRLGYFIGTEGLRLAACAVALQQAAQDFRQMSTPEEENVLLAHWDNSNNERSHSQSSLRHLLNEFGWRYPVTFCLRLNFEPENWLDQDVQRIRQLYEIATNVIREPEPSNERLLVFNLRESVTVGNGTLLTVDALLNIFRDEEDAASTPFDVFKQLYRWQQNSIIRNVVLAIRKRGVSDLMLYDWLSDGEQLFVGRMALFHLLRGESDVLVLLDEPETHFNGVWKRRIVDIIDDNLRDLANEIIITTHSSIALTDVFRVEVTMLHFLEREGRVVQLRTPVHTFGASMSVILREIFGSPESIGQRATEFLNLILMLAAHPEDVHTIWSNETIDKNLTFTPSFQNLLTYIQQLSYDYGEGDELNNYLLKILQNIKLYTQRNTGRESITVVDTLLLLEDLVGEGYYQFELQRRLSALQDRDE